MNIKRIAANQTELHLNDGTVALFSYETPVAAFIPGKGYLRTDKYFSTTTSRHINKWIDGLNTTTIPQDELDKLAA